VWSAKAKTGFLGGTFDPVHIGHLIIAQDALEALGLERVYLVPAALAPMRKERPAASDADRLAMIRACTARDARLGMLDWEIQASGTSYTVQTVRRLREEAPEAPFYWIIGGDQLEKLGHWREVQELTRLIDFIVVERPGHRGEVRAELPDLRLHRVTGHSIALSATNVRERFAAGKPNDLFLPREVAEYIQQHNLYGQCTNTYERTAN